MKKTWKIIIITIIILGALTGLTFLIFDLLEPIKQSLDNNSWEFLTDKFSSYGIFALLVIGFIQTITILITFVPAAPLQIIAGVVLNPISAFLTLIAGVFLGNLLMFIIIRKFNSNLKNYYLKQDGVGELVAIEEESRLSKKVVFLYFLPIISYGLIAFTCANSKMKFSKYILITTLGTIPSIIISISLGSLLVDAKYLLILIIILAILSLLTLVFRKNIQKLFSKKKKDINFFQKNVRKPSKSFYWFFKSILKGLYFKKVNLNIKNKEILKDVNEPFLLLYNHPSMLDWLYTFIPLYPKRINAIVAYYYFCDYRLGKLLHRLGAFPKFLYQPDISSIKNIKKVIKSGGSLGIAPEGRLSAYGELETIAPATEKLIKHLGIPVYLGMVNGAYLTYPKWASNMRKGRIDLNYELLLTSEEIKSLSIQEIEKIINEKMYYNDFKWQAENKVYFKGEKFAEGLENILYLCPKCKSEFSLHTSNNKIKCNVCDLDIVLNNYYQFEKNSSIIIDDKEIPASIRDWFLIQKEYEKANVEKDEYVLSSKVTLKLPHPKGKKFYEVGTGIVSLSFNGLRYIGTLNDEEVNKEFKIQNIPALPFGANQNFEVYHDNTLYSFVLENPKHSVKWSVVEEAIYNKYLKENTNHE